MRKSIIHVFAVMLLAVVLSSVNLFPVCVTGSKAESPASHNGKTWMDPNSNEYIKTLSNLHTLYYGEGCYTHNR